MIIQKIYWHIQSMVKLVLYKLIYGNKLRIGSITFRERFNISLQGGGNKY